MSATFAGAAVALPTSESAALCRKFEFATVFAAMPAPVSC